MNKIHISTEQKVFIGIGLVTLLIMTGGILLLTKQNERLNQSLMGHEIKIEGRNHLPDGTEIQYNSNPPAGGPHYATTAHAGIYDKDKAPADGYLVHSLEHGAAILWYQENLPQGQVEKLKKVFNESSGKKIMVPRKNLDVPVALTSWGYLLKLSVIDEAKIKEFIETNNDRAPEKAPI